MTIVRSGVFALDDVVFSYTGLSEVSQVLQSSRGDTTGAYARAVSYAYDTQPVSGGNYSRLQTLTYPDGATQGFKYGASSSTPDSRISRATQLDLGSTALVGYGYIGMGTVAVTDYKVPGIQLDRYRAPSGASTVGSYPELDKFGRVLRQMWVDTGFTTGSGGNPDRPPVVSTLYAYTKSSDRTQAVDDRPGAAQPLSQGYDYDRLHRLVEAKRGAWTGTAVPTGAGSQRWHDDTGAVTLDALGNWRFSWTDLDGSGSYSDATERDDRTHDIFNRIVGHVLKGQGSGGSDLNLGDLSYDRASNLASWKLQSGTSATAVTAKHDAWNRLTEVSFGGTLRCRQAHNALHWRSFQLSDRTGAGAGPDGTMDQARLMSYGADWRLLEERVDDNLSLSAWTEGTWSPGTDLDRVQQYVWGTRYVDVIVLHRVDRNTDGDYSDPGDGTWHHLTDAQFSSVCLIDKAFAVAERVTYSAYGVATHIPMADLNCDGAVNGADIPGLLTAFGSIGSSPYQSPADLNRDGVVNSADLAMLLGDFQAAQPDGALSRPEIDNPIGWDGYVFDRESGLYTVRFRTYETGLGRWIERDPAGYVDGAGQLEYGRSSPVGALDSLGLWYAHQHAEMTEYAFAAAFPNVPEVAKTCADRVLRILVNSNLVQDKGELFSDLRRHFNRHPDGPNSDPAQMLKAYTDYLKWETELFNASIGKASPDMSECTRALEALGRLSHSWQDYFAHALIHRDRQVVKDPLWTANPPVTGSPDDPAGSAGLIRPSSWPWEHGFSEVAYAEGDARMKSARDFTSSKFRAFLRVWSAKCKCFCKEYAVEGDKRR